MPKRSTKSVVRSPATTATTLPSLNGEATIDARCTGDDDVNVRRLSRRRDSPSKDPMTVKSGEKRKRRRERTETVTLVIPVKNEAGNISWVLERVPDCVDEIILVDGSSTDATLVTALHCRPNVRVVAQPQCR